MKKKIVIFLLVIFLLLFVTVCFGFFLFLFVGLNLPFDVKLLVFCESFGLYLLGDFILDILKFIIGTMIPDLKKCISGASALENK